MTTSYLLPCTCGQKVTVDSSLAGLSVRCACGAELNVPTMRGLAALERVEAVDRPLQAGAPAKRWGPRQGMIFLGLAIVAMSAIPGGFFLLTFPQAPSLAANFHEENRASLDDMPIQKTFELWGILQEDLDERPEFPQFEQWLRYEAFYRHCLKIVGVVAGCGLAIAISGFFFKR